MVETASGEYPVITLEGNGQVIQGNIVYLSYDSIAVRMTAPMRGGCIRMKVHPPYDHGFLVDDEGYINKYGEQRAAETLLGLYQAANHLAGCLDEIGSALTQARLTATEANQTDSWVLAKAYDLLEARVGKVDLATFCSTVEEWLSEGRLRGES